MKARVGPIDLAELSGHHDQESRPTFLTLYVDLTDSRFDRAIAARASEIRAALATDDASLALFDAAFESASDALKEVKIAPGARGAAVFTSPANDFLVAHALAEPVKTSLVLDSGPYVRPLARYADEYESFVLVLLDGERGAVYIVDSGASEKQAETRMDLIGRHKKGGFSQMRYQRHRQGRVEALLDEIVDAVAKLVREGEAERIILAGPGQAKRHLLGRFPSNLKDAVIAVEDVDFADDDRADIVRRFVELARAEEAEDSQEAVDALRTAITRDELAVTGAYAVARAARDGRVALLVLAKDHKAGGRKCEEHATFFADDAACSCGSKGSQVDMLNEAVEGAVQSESRIEFVARDDAFMKGIGGVGAILRY